MLVDVNEHLIKKGYWERRFFLMYGASLVIHLSLYNTFWFLYHSSRYITLFQVFLISASFFYITTVNFLVIWNIFVIATIFVRKMSCSDISYNLKVNFLSEALNWKNVMLKCYFRKHKYMYNWESEMLRWQNLEDSQDCQTSPFNFCHYQ